MLTSVKEPTMKKMLKSNRGNITIAMLLAVMAVMSGLTLTNLAMSDVVSANWDYEGLQCLHFLRSEALRGQQILQAAGDVEGALYTPVRTIGMKNSNMQRTFVLQSKIEKKLFTGVSQEQGSSINAIGTPEGFVIKSLINAKSGFGYSAFINGRNSIVRRYGEFYLRKQRYSEFMYFTDTDESTNGTPVYFWGPDVIHGRVHSNTDIWIKNGGGGINGGWPTFYDLVTTSTEVKSASGVIPYEDVFQGGYAEGYNQYDYPENMHSIRRNGILVGGAYYDENKIVYVEVNEASYNGWLGTKTPPYIEHAFVYNPYPAAPLPDPLFRNTYAIQDTTWQPLGGGSGYNRTMWSHNELWIKGTFSGKQTWATADTMYLVGDILLKDTVVGYLPDGNPPNRTDIVGLVSEKSILIKYGYVDPADSTLRIHPNCGESDSDTLEGGISIYAALCALGKGDIPQKDGVFTFEYQRPHPSVPTVFAAGQLWTNIDLHRRRWPQNASNPWPGNVDFPWYNPLWPERTPYMERGDINLYGSVAQRRRGFVHRSPYDTEYPSGGVWNIPIDFTGATAVQNYADPVLGIPMFTMNYPGATGSGVGYAKNYHYDTRFYTTAPLNFPEVNLQGGDAPMLSESWLIKKPPRDLH